MKQEVKELVADRSKSDCTAVVAISSSGQRTVHRAWKGQWRRRVWAIIWHKDRGYSEKPSLPRYAGEDLDSYLSEPILEKVTEIHSQFLAEHGDVIEKHLLERVHQNPHIQRVIARHTVSTLRAAMEPLTDEMYKTLVHLIQLQLSGQVTGELGHQTGDVITHLLTDTTLSAFATALLHAFHGALGKFGLMSLIAGTFYNSYMSAGTIIAKAVIAGSVTTGGTALATHGSGAVCAAPLWLLLLPVVVGIVAWQIHRFPKKMGKKVAKQVKKIMKGDFDSRNRTALEMMVQDMLKDNAEKVCESIVYDSDLAEKAMAAAKEIVEAMQRGKEQGQTVV